MRKANGELLRRHPTDVILLIQCDSSLMNDNYVLEDDPVHKYSERPTRIAKSSCTKKIRDLANSDLI